MKSLVTKITYHIWKTNPVSFQLSNIIHIRNNCEIVEYHPLIKIQNTAFYASWNKNPFHFHPVGGNAGSLTLLQNAEQLLEQDAEATQK